MAGRLIEVELRVRDVDRSLRFYRDLLGLSLGQPEVHQDGGARHVHASWGSWAERAKDFLLFNSILPRLVRNRARTSVSPWKTRTRCMPHLNAPVSMSFTRPR